LKQENGMKTDEILPYPKSMILLVEVGSTAHGTGLPGGEDHDETAVVIETPEQVLFGPELKNKMYRTQPEGVRSGPGDVDRQVYSLRSFLKLCTDGNPSIQLVMYAPIEEVTPLGAELRNLAPYFIGRHIIPRYRGYMNQQVMRLKGLKGNGHGKRGGGKREELIAEHGYDTKYAMHAARLGFQCKELIEEGKLTLPIQGEPGQWLRAVRRGEIPYEEWELLVATLDKTLENLQSNDRYPEKANKEKIMKWSVTAHREYWNWECKFPGEGE
jgi:hypothetical protein